MNGFATGLARRPALTLADALLHDAVVAGVEGRAIGILENVLDAALRRDAWAEEMDRMCETDWAGA